ncbi:DNA methyltransferase [Neobacillus drentensis]|uniref:DNA methyltransferase n=1 Tax=Neobacillus drentensis TaxID=220684 RepID=UPI002FFFDAD7
MAQDNYKKDDYFWRDLNLNYSGENNYASFFPSKSNTHAYPAKAVPDMVFELLNHIKSRYNIKSVLDPFVGSGTTALESKYLGLDFYGSDLNPLAILIARTKVLTLSNSNYMIKTIKDFVGDLQLGYENANVVKLTTFNNIDYWFKEENIRELSYIKEKINQFLKGKGKKNIENYALILLNSFSSSIRYCSLSRNSEFKLYRMSPSDIEKFNVNAVEVFSNNIIGLLEMLKEVNRAYKVISNMQVELGNAKELNFMEDKKVDLILTSPPYGDSSSTVAYGQFSRLSLQWASDLLNKYLGIKVYSDNCDEYLLGGKKSEIEAGIETILSRSITLQNLVSEMDQVINEDVEQLNEMKCELNNWQKQLEAGNIFTLEQIDNKIFALLRERVRLDFYREYNKETNLSRKEVKKLSAEKTDHFFEELFNGHVEDDLDNIEFLKEKLKRVLETIKRKIQAVPKRKDEVLNFFKDLYQVVVSTDRVLNHDGIQAWIVGHRTVLGKININMKDVLNDWFENIGYEKVTDLTREYSFKRLPHHINSTVNRNDQIKTMMQEYILIVKKP